MGRRRGLIDSNVLIAAASEEHLHHGYSRRYLAGVNADDFVTSIHCLSECYNGLTRRPGQGGLSLTPPQAAAAIRDYARAFDLLQLTVEQQLEAYDRFAELGGVGPRVYDYLIGQVAVVHAIPLIVTWNDKHFAPLFRTIRVATPAELLQET